MPEGKISRRSGGRGEAARRAGGKSSPPQGSQAGKTTVTLGFLLPLSFLLGTILMADLPA